MEEDQSFLFLKKNLMKIFVFFLSCLRSTSPMPLIQRLFFLKKKKIRNLEFFKELKILIDEFFLKILEILNFSRNWKFWLMFIFIFFLQATKKYEPNALSLKAFFENFLLLLLFFFFFFLKDLERFFFFFWKFYLLSFFIIFYFFEIWRFVHYQKVKKMKIKVE